MRQASGRPDVGGDTVHLLMLINRLQVALAAVHLTPKPKYGDMGSVA